MNWPLCLLFFLFLFSAAPIEAEMPDDSAVDVKPPVSSLSKELPCDDSENYQSCEELFSKSCKSGNFFFSFFTRIIMIYIFDFSI